MKKELTITIAGQAGTGKSTFMYEFYKFLWVSGFDVDVNLDNEIEFENEIDFRRKMIDNREERLNSLKKNVKITLRTMQVKSEIKEKYPDQD